MWLTVSDVAKELKCSTSTVRAMIDCGRLEAMPIGSGTKRRTYRIHSDAVRNIKPPERRENKGGASTKTNPALLKRIR